MDTIGLDLHKRESQLCILTEDGEIMERRIGRISKTGNSRMRYLLVAAAWRRLRTNDLAAASLRAWAECIAQHRGRSIAAVALARRLAGILYAMWRDGKDYRAPQSAAVAVA
jgi:transposase